MTNKNVKQFLPRQFRTNKIRNFMDSTTETLFTSKNSEDVPFYIGRTPGGLFQPFKDYYSEEDRKIREDYQLEQTLVIKDVDSGEIKSATFYEDLLNNLESKGSYVSDHNRIFNSKSYSYAPPIDMDMFINFNNYYWYPEGIMAFHVNAQPEDIIGKTQYQATITESNQYIMLSSGHHIILNDDKEYIVEGVGRFINLIEFSLENNKPKRIDRLQIADNEIQDLIDRFPAEYITMERGSLDDNPWSRNNCWYHRDVVNQQVGQERFSASRERQAKRPIICFDKNIELYNYSNTPYEYVTLFSNNLSIATDGVIVQVNDLAIQEGNPKIYRYDGNNFVEYDKVNDGYKVTILDGNYKADEFKWDEQTHSWIQCQQKIHSTQAPLFNLYDNNDSSKATLLNDPYRYPNSDFKGNKIFSYKTDIQDGIYDEYLDLNILYKTFQESSDIVFENFMDEQYSYEAGGVSHTINNHFYKKLNPEKITSDNIYLFTIHKDENDEPTIYINDEKLPNLILKENIQYKFDFSDTTTTPRGWSGKYNSISIKDSNGKKIIDEVNGDNSNNIRNIEFSYDKNKSENNIYTYTIGSKTGYIIIEDDIIEDELYKDIWEEKTSNLTTFLQKKVFNDEDINSGRPHLEFEFIPKNDNFEVELNGDRLIKDEDFYFEDLKIYPLNDNLSSGDYLEVKYETFERIEHYPNEAIQMIQDSLSNNPMNENVEQFAFTEIFNHFRSIIFNQHYIKGSSLSENNFRDTVKDRSKGNKVLKHDNSMVPLMFINDNNSRDIVDSIYNSMRAYSSFKNLIVLNTEDIMKNKHINKQNVRDVFDKIIGNINLGKTTRQTFSQTYMFGTYRKFINLEIDNNGKLNEFADTKPINNELYIFTNEGIKIRDIDYEISIDDIVGETKIIPKSFDISDIDEIRYYEDMDPSFCPSTPAKFGLEKPFKPEIIEDDSFKNKQHFIIGHDGSKTPVYSNYNQIEENDLDPRDLILLEFEKRIYNGIDKDFIETEKKYFDYNYLKEGYFRKSSYDLEQFKNTEFNIFHIWSYNNNVNYSKNTQYDEDNPWTYNYSLHGSKLPGHWKGIYEYLYDTHRPDIRPWEMLGFSIKPAWWDNEYGSDYSSNNVQLWNDLEQGIIRQGERSNAENMRYMSVDNIYRRIGLKELIPVKNDGTLKDPVELGLFNNYPTYYNASQPWEYGDLGPVEQSWKRQSDYFYAKQIVHYLLKPLDYINKAWNTFETYSKNSTFFPNVINYEINNQKNNNYVPGVTQWIHDYIRENDESVEDIMIDAFNGINVVLGHKLGGYIDTQNLRIISESYNPRSGNVNSSLPEDDINVFVHESKDIREEVYSGVIIERVAPNRKDLNFIKGELYQKGDIVYISNDDSYYKNVKSLYDYPEWNEKTTYVKNRAVIYNNTIWNCIVDHSPQNIPPTDSNYWELRGFIDSEWALMFDAPDPKYTVFKVYGYDPYGSQFKTIPAKTSGKKKTITSITNESEAIDAKQWEPLTNYEQGEYRTLPNGKLIRALEKHKSGQSFDNEYWTIVENIPYTNIAKTTVGIEGDDSILNVVPYGTTFRNEKDVSEFIIAYGRYLESRGWLFDERDKNRNIYKNWELSVKEFIQWAYENKNEGSVISLSPSSMNIRFKSDHGVPSISRNYNKNKITLLDNRSRIITPSENTFNRENDVFQITPQRPIYYARVNVREYEHAMVINNRTIFSDVLYNPLYGIRKERLQVNARKTKDWNGKLEANGYIILDNRLLPNFESSITDLKTINDMDSISTQYIFNTLKYHNIGFENRSYLENINMDEKSQIQFYSGFIRQKGTSEAFQRILRSNQIEADENMGINEEWAFKEGEFGSLINNQTTEYVLNRMDYISSPQNIILRYNGYGEDITPSYNDILIESSNRDKWLKFPSRFSQYEKIWTEDRLSNLKVMPTAGYVNYYDVDYTAFSLSELNTKIINSGKELQPKQYAWIARDGYSGYGFNVYISQEDKNITVKDIEIYGEEDISSMILRLNNVEENSIYSLYNLGYKYTFTFKRVDENDNLFIALPYDNSTYITLNEDLTKDDLNNSTFIIWKPLRINKFYNTIYNDIQDTIDRFIQKNNIDVFDGLKLFIDSVNSNVSYKQSILESSALEYWTFDNKEDSTFIGHINDISLTTNSDYAFENPNNGLILGDKSLKGGTNYDPSNNNWPQSFWADLGNHLNLSNKEKSIQFWINNGEFSYRYNQSVSTTIASIVGVDLDTSNTYTVQLMVDPPIVGSEWSYKIVYMVNDIIDQELDAIIESGYNQIVLNYKNINGKVHIESFINGLNFEELVSSSVINVDNNVLWYTVIGDSAEPESDMPYIDHVSVYDYALDLKDIQEQYDIALETIKNENKRNRWAVYYFNSGKWNLDYKEQDVIDCNLMKDITVYESNTNNLVTHLNIFDPIKGFYPSSLINYIDYFTEYDPANYHLNDSDNNSYWTDSKVGTLWLDTSKLRYIEYENFDIETRNNLWGSLFPGSEVHVYEWIKTKVLPENIEDQSVILDTTKYTIGSEYDVLTDNYIEYYYYWVKNNINVPETSNRNVNAVDIANSIKYPENNGTGYIQFLRNDIFSIIDINNDLVDNDTVIQINYRLGYNEQSRNHSQWKLLSRNSKEIPEYLFNNMVDSLLGYTEPSDQNPEGLKVPNPNLAPNNRYGNDRVKRQSWFYNAQNARKIFYEVINNVLKYINLWDTDIFWERRVDNVKRDTELYSLVDWYKEDFDPDTIVRNKIKDRNFLNSIPLEDGEHIAVNETAEQNTYINEKTTVIYRYIKEYNTYEKVFQTRSALSFNPIIYKRELTAQEAIEMRRILNVIFNYILIGENKDTIFELFFRLVEQIFVEQPNNDWVYPSTYISINQKTNTLTKSNVYRQNREQQIIDYVNEAKPFHTKLRTINRTHTREPENIGLFVTDFDKPPYLTEDKDQIILQEYVTEKIRYRKNEYYYHKIMNSNPYEYWSMNNIQDNKNIQGLYGNDFILNDNPEIINIEQNEGISYTNNICLSGTSNYSYTNTLKNFETNSFNIEWWFTSPNNLSEGRNSFVLIKFNNNNKVNTIEFVIDVDADNIWQYKVIFVNSLNENIEINLNLIFNNKANYISIGYSNGDIRLYNNNRLASETSIEFLEVLNSDIEVMFGNNNTNDIVCFDEIAIYPRMISKNEAIIHYNAGDIERPQNEFELQKIHDLESIEVYIEDQKLPKDSYQIIGNTLIFNNIVQEPINYYNNITVRSNNLDHINILNNYKNTRGYMSVNQDNLKNWKSTVNQKSSTIVFDRISLLPTFSLEQLLKIKNNIDNSDKPLEKLTNYSLYNHDNPKQTLSEIDRIIIQHHSDLLENIVNETKTIFVNSKTKKNISIDNSHNKDNISVFINDIYINERYYKINTKNGKTNLEFVNKLYKGDVVKVRSKDDYRTLIQKSSEIRGVGIPYHNIDEINELPFVINSNTSPIKLNDNGELIIEQDYIDDLEESNIEPTLVESNSDFNNSSANNIRHNTPFIETSHRGVPEEKSSLNFKESMCVTYKNNLKLVPRGYETSIPLNIFETVTFNSDGTETEYPINLNVHKEQVMVLVNDDEWVMDDEENNIQYHYELRPNKIIFHKSLNYKDKVVITDRYSAFDRYGGNENDDYGINVQGGYDSNMILPNYLNDINNPDHEHAVHEYREFVLYNYSGKVFLFKCDEKDAINVKSHIHPDEHSIELETITDKLKPVNNENGKLLALYASRMNNDKLEHSFVEFIHYKTINNNNRTLEDVKRSIFSTGRKYFDIDKYHVKAYPIDIENQMPQFTILEPYIGINSQRSYPKYGHIMSGKD
ncbi:hypothetical protein PBI_SCTP2_140 [Salicola phage SCTP-2]|nr:hypothetical protein PBI_SCTP2_140 [Salicola phage SCTP-2]